MHVPVALSDEDSVSQDGPPQLSPQQQQPSNLVADRFRELQESSAADADSPHNGNDDDENSVDRKPFDDVDPEGTLSANSSIQQTPTPTNGSPTSRPLRRRTGDSDDDEEEPGGSSLRQSNFGADAASAADEEIRVTKFEPPTVLSSPQLLAANPAASTSAAALPLTKEKQQLYSNLLRLFEKARSRGARLIAELRYLRRCVADNEVLIDRLAEFARALGCS
uniref:DUF4614 domain-containing protein n=1 Tax=Macrostomum lignano TaxID=282301 RepID=A0A1I8IFK0_9PLAT